MIILLFLVGILAIILTYLIENMQLAWQSALVIGIYIAICIDWVRLRWRVFRDSDL